MREPLRPSEGPSTSGSIDRRVSSRLVRRDRRHRRSLDVDDVVHLEMQLAAAGRDELHREIGFFQKVRAVRLADALDRHLEHFEAHLRQVVERLVPVDPLFHVDLADPGESRALQRVHQEARLHAVAAEERELLEQRSAAGLLAGKGLHDPGELGKKEIQDWPRGELSHAAAAGRLQLVADVERSLVEGLHELQVRPHEERTDDAVHELRVRARDVGVDPHDDVAREDVQALPERLAFPAVAARLGKDLVVDEDGDAFVFCDLAGPILRARVDDDELVDQRKTLDEARADGADDLADGRLFVERRKSDRDAEVLALFRVDEPAKVRELRRAERVLGEPFVDDLAEHATAFRALERKARPLHEHRRDERRTRADDQRVLRVGDDPLADGPERIARALAAGRAEHDRVVLGQLVSDHLRRVARPRHEPLDALVVRALTEQLVEGLCLSPAVALGDVKQRHSATLRFGQRDPEAGGELRIAAATHGDEDALRARGTALHHGEIAWRLAQDRLDRRPEDVPSGPAPGDDEQVRPLGRAGFADRLPTDAGDGHEAAEVSSGKLARHGVERTAPSTCLGLRGRQSGIAGDLDGGGEDDLAVPGERGGGLEEASLALGIADRDDDLHTMPSSTSGTTRSARTRDHAMARTRERKRGPGSPRDRSIASAMTSPDASGGTYVAASPASARRVGRSLHTMGRRWRAASSNGMPKPSLWLGSKRASPSA